MRTHVPGLQYFFTFFASFVLAILATVYRVVLTRKINLPEFTYLVQQGKIKNGTLHHVCLYSLAKLKTGNTENSHFSVNKGPGEINQFYSKTSIRIKQANPSRSKARGQTRKKPRGPVKPTHGNDLPPAPQAESFTPCWLCHSAEGAEKYHHQSDPDKISSNYWEISDTSWWLSD